MKSKHTFRYLSRYMSKYWKIYVVLFCTTILGIVTDLSIAWVLSLVTNAAVELRTDQWSSFLYLGLGILFLIGFYSFIDTYFKAKDRKKRMLMNL